MELNGSVGYNLVASSFRQSFRLRATLNQWFMRALVGGAKRMAALEYLDKQSNVMGGPRKIRSRGSWSHIVSKATDA